MSSDSFWVEIKVMIMIVVVVIVIHAVDSSPANSRMCHSLAARVSRFVSSKEQSSMLISLLLPYLQKGNKSQVRLTTEFVEA